MLCNTKILLDMTLLKVDIFMKKWFFSNDPTHDDRANQTHINSLFIERNRPLQPLWVTGVLLCRGNVPRTRPERASAYVAVCQESVFFMLATPDVGDNSFNVQLLDGFFPFCAQQEVAVGLRVLEKIFRQDGRAHCVVEDIESRFKVRITIGIIRAQAMSGQPDLGRFAQARGQIVRERLAPGSVAAPAAGIHPFVAASRSVHVDAHQADIPAAQLGANAVHPPAAS